VGGGIVVGLAGLAVVPGSWWVIARARRVWVRRAAVVGQFAASVIGTVRSRRDDPDRSG
jgi:hypothetical protein